MLLAFIPERFLANSGSCFTWFDVAELSLAAVCCSPGAAGSTSTDVGPTTTYMFGGAPGICVLFPLFSRSSGVTQERTCIVPLGARTLHSCSIPRRHGGAHNSLGSPSGQLLEIVVELVGAHHEKECKLRVRATDGGSWEPGWVSVGRFLLEVDCGGVRAAPRPPACPPARAPPPHSHPPFSRPPARPRARREVRSRGR